MHDKTTPTLFCDCKSKGESQLARLSPLGMDSNSLAKDFNRYFYYTLGRDKYDGDVGATYKALALTLRARLMERWKNTRAAYEESDCKRTYYLSLEFLMGRALGNTMLSLDVTESTREALYGLGLNLEEIAEKEADAGLGNGGLGRLAACFLDSCATLQLPVKGYGLRYEYGMFRQNIAENGQLEEPDHWLRSGNPWEMERLEYTRQVQFGGRTETYADAEGRERIRWVDTRDVLAIPYDIPIPGYRNGIVNTLRLWKATATDAFDLGEFNAGSYPESVAAKNEAEHITMVLYPNDSSENGKILRLRQQYFLASASLKDAIAEWKRLNNNDLSRFAEKNCFQLNDTHPSCAVPELMRLLIDEEGMEWDQAWAITSQTMAYTNHTLLPEALEKWPVRLYRELLPRLLEIIYDINVRFLTDVSTCWPADMDRQWRMSIIEEGPDPQIRMAYLAIVGSFSVNGVAALHSRLLKEGLFKDFYELWPEKFNNKTNGVTQRRWLAACNPGLKKLIDDTIHNGWIADLTHLHKLAPHADNPAFRAQWHAVKQENKARLAALVERETGVIFTTDALFDVQVKRIHEYKRQLLNVLHIIHLYACIKAGQTDSWVNRCVLIGGKAAPGYAQAKLIIRLICNVAKRINADPATEGLLRVAFFPNYRVSAMEVICPGTDLSEQISTAGKEASGTGNMKFMMNGALTIGTLDGANIEIREEVGDDHFFLFGLTEEQVHAARPHYNPNQIIEQDGDFSRVMHLLESGHFNQFEAGLFNAISHSLRSPHDPWMVAADFASYVEAQEHAAACYRDQDRWVTSSIMNTAASGRFSSDRTITEYNNEIWKMEAVSATQGC